MADKRHPEDERKTKKQLIAELAELRRRTAELEASEAERKRAEEEVRQKTEDLALIHSLNHAVNRGASLHDFIELLCRETQRSFSGTGATVYLLSEDKEHLVMQNLPLPPTAVNRIEQLIGMRIPPVRISLKPGRVYRKVLLDGRPQIINDPATIQRMMAECTENETLQKLVPAIYRVLGRGSVMAVPLVSEGQAVGLLDISRDEPFTESDLERFETISEHLTGLIGRKRAEEALKEYRNHLEDLVEERTAELEQEITARKRAEEVLSHRVEQLAALSQASQAVATSLELDQVLAQIASLASEVVPSDYTSVVLVGEAGHIGQSVEDLPGVPSIEYRARDEGLTSWIIHSRQPVVIDEIGEDGVIDPDLGEEAPRFANPHIVEAGVKSVAGLPLMTGGNLIGVLYLHSLHPGAFRGQLPLLTAFASQAAIATENARLYGAERAARERLQTLSNRLVEVQEAERRHIARELHDEIGQMLTGLKLALQMSMRHPDEAVRQGKLEATQALIDDLMARVESLSLDLRPSMLDELGLLPTLLWHVERYTAHTNVHVHLKHVGVAKLRFAPEIETAVYRIVQEALTNVARHAGVSEAVVRLWAHRDLIGVQIEDAGRGFDPATVLGAAECTGLAGMRERATLLNGRITFESAPDARTRVTAELPLDTFAGQREKGRNT